MMARFGRAKTGSLVRRLAFWMRQDRDVAEYVRLCQTYQRTKVEHGGPPPSPAAAVAARE